ncbi:hypothetical protein XA68_15778 [Ophiocordyceps unilateralis]|uniref:Uncharacterized protein n=1 Tax=Ophiocordyceps unilateralis TaxID=268505 RepID=A0A2A9P7E0_OPHUN|nr:hypothetical protein XA68_15778 [Ophiocordyceps unilateralis]
MPILTTVNHCEKDLENMHFGGAIAAAAAAAATALAMGTSAAASQFQLHDRGCISESKPNPIAPQWPTHVTGNLNGTTLIVPIAYQLARKAIPSQFAILDRAYRSLLPNLPKDRYPMMVTAVHDHDLMVKSANLSLSDFSRAVLEFPFVDRLHDGYSTFRWAATMLITEGSDAIKGSEAYGIKVYPAKFDPGCDAYQQDSKGFTTFKATTSDHSRDGRFMSLSTLPDYNYTPYPLDFIRNISNQPTFARSDKCDNFIRLFNTSLTETPHEPVPVRGDVTTKLEPLWSSAEHSWYDVYGWRFSTAFIEPPLPVSCQSLKGYSGTGPGD